MSFYSEFVLNVLNFLPLYMCQPSLFATVAHWQGHEAHANAVILGVTVAMKCCYGHLPMEKGYGQWRI